MSHRLNDCFAHMFECMQNYNIGLNEVQKTYIKGFIEGYMGEDRLKERIEQIDAVAEKIGKGNTYCFVCGEFTDHSKNDPVGLAKSAIKEIIDTDCQLRIEAMKNE